MPKTRSVAAGPSRWYLMPFGRYIHIYIHYQLSSLTARSAVVRDLKPGPQQWFEPPAVSAVKHRQFLAGSPDPTS